MIMDINLSMEELLKSTIKGNKVYCYGAGIIGREFCKKASDYDFNFENIILVDNDLKKSGIAISISGIDFKIIHKNDMIDRILSNDIIIFSIGEKFYGEVYREFSSIEKFNDIKVSLSNALFLNQMKSVNEIQSNKAYCYICQKETLIAHFGKYPREDYRCTECKSIPRQRALIAVLNKCVPNWKELIIHESSPGGQSSDFINDNCENYSMSHYFKESKSGDIVIYNGSEYLSQNIEQMSFENNSIDLFITQDVLEHVLNPNKAFKEIERVLKKGGKHIFTTPYFEDLEKSICRAEEKNGEVVYLKNRHYHGNPVDENGSLVTFDYGKDLLELIKKSSNMETEIYNIEDEALGLIGKMKEVFVSTKI